MNNIAETTSNNSDSSEFKTDSEFLEGSISLDGVIAEEKEKGGDYDAQNSPRKKMLDSENAQFLHKSLKKQKKLVITRQVRKEQFKIALEWLHQNKEFLHSKKNYAVAGIGGVTNKPKPVVSKSRQKSSMSQKGIESGPGDSSRRVEAEE